MAKLNNNPGFYQRHKSVIWTIIGLVAFYIVWNGFIQPSMGGAFGSSPASQDSYRESGTRGFGMSKMAFPSQMRASSPPMVESVSEEGSPSLPYAPSVESSSAPDEEKRIRKAGYLNLEVEKDRYDQAKSSIEGVMNANKGFYTAKKEQKQNYREVEFRTYFTTIRVPVDRFDAAVDQLKGVASLKSLNVDATDVTNQFHDLKMEMVSQLALMGRVEDLLKRAEKMEDIIKIEEKLSQYQQRVDEIKKQITNLARQTDYSTIEVSLEEEHEVKESFYAFTGARELVKNVVQSFDSVVVMFTALSGWIVVALIIWGVYRWWNRTKK